MKLYLKDNLGIETECSVFIPLLKKGSPIPCQRVRALFAPANNNQSSIEIKVKLEVPGECSESQLLGIIRFDDVSPNFRGVPFISISLYVGIDKRLLVEVENLKDGSLKHLHHYIDVTGEQPSTYKIIDQQEQSEHIELTKTLSIAKRMIQSTEKSLSLSDTNKPSIERMAKKINSIIGELQTFIDEPGDLETVISIMDDLSNASLELHYTAFSN